MEEEAAREEGVRRHARIFWRGTLSCARTRRAGVRARAAHFLYTTMTVGIESRREVESDVVLARRATSCRRTPGSGTARARRVEGRVRTTRVASRLPRARSPRGGGVRWRRVCSRSAGLATRARGSARRTSPTPRVPRPSRRRRTPRARRGRRRPPPRRRGRTRGVRTRFASRPSPPPRGRRRRASPPRDGVFSAWGASPLLPPPPSTSTLRRP